MTDDEFGLCDHMDELLFRSATPEEIVWANGEKN